MLDTDTRRRIDTARDILVGKVPDPKSQVEQITIAMIYKFMDDMDSQSEELGGRRTFFEGEWARYRWTTLVRSGLGGFETLNLYAEAIQRMPENPGIPELFRSIFRNAYLPYRDPETLRAFLKVIDGFEYDNSERLGDAYEYLLSIMSSQGDAGQFRTPRHIIDFMVAIVDPKKHETVLDPACGTAGFLISSFKHILVANTDPNGDSTLSAEERELLARNFTGYDISPDMVRLSLVNLYLHGFRAPRIFEYDTLTSEERWNDHADVILANPPFMSPKGGIQPHKRFSVQSNRSEVLFVDYMAEHLTPSGRAGIIVPEGVIFQSGNAYKQLRRMLVENYLVAVISLPAGVFNPYSGVKTSILILDRTLAKRASTIGFFKVENDGFGLGAQRKEIVGDDLPATLSEVQHYLAALQTQAPLSEAQPAHGLIVARTRLADRDDYSLAIERYRDNDIRHSTYPWTELGTITLGSPQYGSGARKVPYDGEIRYVRITDLTDAGDLKQADPVSPSVIEPDCFLAPGDLLIARSGSVGRAYLHGNVPGTYQFAGYLIRFRIDPERALPAFVFSVMQSDAWKDWILSNSKTGTLTNINAKQYSSFRFPLPPLDVQREIVAEIEGYQRVIDGARAVVDNYRPRIAIDPAWPMVKVGSVSIVNPKKSEVADQSPTLEVSFVPMADVDQNSMTVESKQSVTLSEVTSSYTYFRDGDVLLAKVAPCFENGKGGIAYGLKSGIGFGSSELFVLRPSSSILAEWLYLCVASQAFRTWATPRMTGTGGLQRVPRSVLEDYEIPLPVLATQRTIVTEVAAEQAIVDANRELIARMEKRIADVLARVWGEA